MGLKKHFSKLRKAFAAAVLGCTLSVAPLQAQDHGVRPPFIPLDNIGTTLHLLPPEDGALQDRNVNQSLMRRPHYDVGQMRKLNQSLQLPPRPAESNFIDKFLAKKLDLHLPHFHDNMEVAEILAMAGKSAPGFLKKSHMTVMIAKDGSFRIGTKFTL